MQRGRFGNGNGNGQSTKGTEAEADGDLAKLGSVKQKQNQGFLGKRGPEDCN